MEAVQKFCIQQNSLIHRVSIFVVVIVLVGQKSYIIECNYCYRGIVLFYLKTGI